MTGRGKHWNHPPVKNPSVSIGVSLSFSPAKYNASSQEPLYMVITARILESLRPDKPITLDTGRNPFHPDLSNRCFKNIVCTSNETSQSPKAIVIWPYYRTQSCGLSGLDVRERGNFITLEPTQFLEIRHEIPRYKIDAADVQSGEMYKSEITDLGLGTRWWMYGTMDDVGEKKFIGWSSRGVEGESQHIRDKAEDEHEYEADGEGEWPDDLKWEDGSEFVMGEDPSTLGIIIENGEAGFEVV